MTEINRQISDQDLNTILNHRAPDLPSREIAGSVLKTIDGQLNILAGILGPRAARDVLIDLLNVKLPEAAVAEEFKPVESRLDEKDDELNKVTVDLTSLYLKTREKRGYAFSEYAASRDPDHVLHQWKKIDRETYPKYYDLMANLRDILKTTEIRYPRPYLEIYLTDFQNTDTRDFLTLIAGARSLVTSNKRDRDPSVNWPDEIKELKTSIIRGLIPQPVMVNMLSVEEAMKLYLKGVLRASPQTPRRVITPLSSLSLSTRLHNALVRHEIDTVEEALEIYSLAGLDYFAGIRNIGSKSVEELRNKFSPDPH